MSCNGLRFSFGRLGKALGKWARKTEHNSVTIHFNASQQFKMDTDKIIIMSPAIISLHVARDGSGDGVIVFVIKR